MRRRQERTIFLYPHYFLSTSSRRLGRRVPRPLSVPNVSKEGFEVALKDIGLVFELKENVAYPRDANKRTFRFEVVTPERKQSIIRKIARGLKGQRSQGAS